MNQKSEEKSYNIKKNNENQQLYSKTSPINQIQQQNYEINNNINNNSNYMYQTANDNNIKNLKNDTNTNTNINIQTITHNETSLVKNLEYLDDDNIKLREALSELNIELKEKEEELGESQKILKKLNDEYGQLVKDFKKLEDEKNLYKEENEKNKKMLESMNKNFNDYDKIMKQNEQLKIELIKNKEIMSNLKGNYTNVTNDFNKIEKDNKYKEIIINDLKIEGNKIINMLQNRELLIEAYSKKISELNNIIKQKDDNLKLMVNFSKELNNKNKNNVKELTKQAVKTIKVFYNYMNNKDNPGQVNYVEIINTNKDKNKNKNINNNISEIIFGNNKNDKNDKKNKCSFLLGEAIQNLLYIPNYGTNYINKEFLIDNNFKTCLLKTELHSSIIREFELNAFFSNIFSKLKKLIVEFDSSNINSDKKNVGGNIKSISNLKIYFDNINKNIIKYKRENSSLKNKLNDLNLYILKLKKDFSTKIQKLKEKMKIIDEKYNNNLNNLKQNLNKSENNEKSSDDKYKEEISKLNQEIDKIKNINHNISQEILEKDEIINKLKNEKEKLQTKLNNLRTNPNGENNSMFVNNDINKDNNISRNNNNLNMGITNYNDIKYNKNKINNSNNDYYYFDYSFNDNLSNNSMKYSTKANSNNFNFNKKKDIRNAIRNMNDLSNNNFNENDISIFIKSKNNNNNYSYLKIENQEQLNYISNSLIKNLNSNSISPIITTDNNNKITDFHNDSNFFEKELLRNTIINNFKSEIKENFYTDLTNKTFEILKIIQQLNTKIQEIKDNLSNIKDKFKNNHKDKKIKPSQLIDIIEQVEILLLYVNNHLNKANKDMQDIHPYLKIIFDLVYKMVYDLQLHSYNNISSTNPITMGINIFKNSSSINNNNNNLKENYLNNNVINKINNHEIEDINNVNNPTRTKENLFPNILELKPLFDINKKIFSSSELIKYRTIYEGLPISKLIQVFKDICKNLKKAIYNSKYDYESDGSDIEDNNTIEETKTSQIITENNSYHFVNQKIFGLKKFEFNYKIFMELLKNYLVTFEIIVNQIEIEINNKNKEKQFELGEELNLLYNIFEDAVYYKMDRLDDDIIFNRKILLKLLLNHKEYLSIIYDI